MQNIVNLQTEELQLLREKIQTYFLATHPLVQKLNANSTPNNYAALIAHMKAKVPDHALEFSPKRLVKLFYGTQPERDKPEAPNFGIRFIDGCYLYFTEGVENREKYHSKRVEKVIEPAQPSLEIAQSSQNPPSRRRFLYFALAAVLVLGMSCLAYCHFTKLPQSFTDDFNYPISAKSLTEHGWQIHWQNDTLLNLQPKNGQLTLYTTRGDMWVKSNEKVFVDNFIYRRIESDCFEVIVKLDSFAPFYEDQQAGLVFFEDIHNFSNFLRLATGGFRIKDTHYQNVGVIAMEKGIPFLYNQPTYEVNDTNKTIRLSFYGSVKKNVFTSGVRGPKEWQPFYEIHPDKEIVLPMKPLYVGLYASHGITRDDYSFKNAPTIPAHFDDFIIRYFPCDK